MNKIVIKILEYKKGQYEGVDYANIVARYGERLIKFKLDKNLPDLTDYIDKTVTAEFEIRSGFQFQADVRIIAIEA